MQVIKRDGRLVEFNQSRIVNAITKSMAQTNGGIDIDLANKIAIGIKKQLENEEQVSVYEIQDLVEKKLMGSSRKEVAQSYITYRYNRDVARKSKTKEVFLNIISAKANDTIKTDLSINSDTPAGMMMKFASETTKPFVDDFLLATDVREAERNGYIDIHDKDYYPTKSLNCIQHPLNKILENGFKARNISSRKAGRIETASNLGWIAMEIIQNETNGEQSIPAFDYLLAPYVRKTFVEELKKLGEDFDIDVTNLIEYKPEEYIKKDIKGLKENERVIQIAVNRTVNRVHQSMEAFIHNLNTIQSRIGNELVYSSISYGTDTSPEGRCIIREVLLATYEGVGYGETARFPIQIWKKKKGINYLQNDKNYDLYQLSLKVTTKRFFPNYINLDATFNQNEKWDKSDSKRWYYECTTMGCGIRIFEDRHGEKTVVGKGNLSFTTINLPKIAIEATIEAQDKLGISFELGIGSEKYITPKYKNTVKKIFMNKLEKYVTIASSELYQRYKFQGTATSKQFPLLMSGIWMNSEKLSHNDTVESVIKHGTLGIGFVGLAECLIALIGKHHGESEEAQNLGIEIINEMKDLTEEFSEKYNLNYTIIAITEEKEHHRFTKLDKMKYGTIYGVTDKEYYTNSSHIPKEYQCSMEKKIITEAIYHNLCRGGHILCIELDKDEINDKENIEKIIEMMDKYDVGYVSINYTKIRCMECGFEDTDINLIKCPNCGSLKLDTIKK